MNVDSVEILKLLVTAGISLFVSAVAFRTRLALMARDITQVRDSATQQVGEIRTAYGARLDAVERAVSKSADTLKLIDRRTLYILQILAEQAKANGLDRRVPDDLLVRMMTDSD